MPAAPFSQAIDFPGKQLVLSNPECGLEATEELVNWLRCQGPSSPDQLS